MVKERKLVILPHQIGVSFRLAAIPSPDTWKTPEKSLWRKKNFTKKIWHLATYDQRTWRHYQEQLSYNQPEWGVMVSTRPKNCQTSSVKLPKALPCSRGKEFKFYGPLWRWLCFNVVQAEIFRLPKFAEPRTKLTDIEFDAAVLGEFGSCLKQKGDRNFPNAGCEPIKWGYTHKHTHTYIYIYVHIHIHMFT